MGLFWRWKVTAMIAKNSGLSSRTNHHASQVGSCSLDCSSKNSRPTCGHNTWSIPLSVLRTTSITQPTGITLALLRKCDFRLTSRRCRNAPSNAVTSTLISSGANALLVRNSLIAITQTPRASRSSSRTTLIDAFMVGIDVNQLTQRERIVPD